MDVGDVLVERNNGVEPFFDKRDFSMKIWTRKIEDEIVENDL